MNKAQVKLPQCLTKSGQACFFLGLGILEYGNLTISQVCSKFHLETIDLSVSDLGELIVSLGCLQELALCIQYAGIACLVLQLELLILQSIMHLLNSFIV